MSRIKTVVVLLITIVLSALTIAAVALLPQRLLFTGGDSYRFYLGDTSADCKEVFSDGASAPLLRIFLADVNGESAIYSHLDVDKFLQDIDGQIVFCEELDGFTNYYCKAPLPYSVKLRGEEINLHICVGQEVITVASPIIFGGY